MKLNRKILIANILCVLAGCGPHVDSAIDEQPDRDGIRDEHEAQQGASSETASLDEELVDLNVTADFYASDADGCEPLNLPVTAFITDAFNQRAPVEESATWSEGGRCRHEQLLVAPAEEFGKLALQVFCQGGDDPRLCRTVSKHSCAVDMLMLWAAERSESAESVVMQATTYGFAFEVPPQGRAARMALYREAQIQVDTLLDDAETVTQALEAGTRGCPNENLAEIDALSREYTELSDELDHILGEDGE